MGKSDSKHSVGKTIAELRKEKGWTQLELAEKLQVSDKAVSKWEKDSGSPSVEFFPMLSKLFGVSIDYLLTGKEAGSAAIIKPKKDDFSQMSEEEKENKVLSVMNNGIISVNKLLATNDFVFIKWILEKYPIHIIEILYKDFQEKNYRKLFRFAVDNNDDVFAGLIIDNDAERIKDYLLSIWNNSKLETFNINKEYLYFIENGRQQNIMYAPFHYAKDIEEVIAKLKICKQFIVDNLALKLDKKQTIGSLTKEYFENELKQGNTDMVIIKLCVRLEAILRSDYYYEGEFSEMLNKYCRGFNDYDDEGNDYDPYTPKMLNKLRLQRNGIVHSEKSKETLTIDEIQWCIDYICQMG